MSCSNKILLTDDNRLLLSDSNYAVYEVDIETDGDRIVFSDGGGIVIAPSYSIIDEGQNELIIEGIGNGELLIVNKTTGDIVASPLNLDTTNNEYIYYDQLNLLNEDNTQLIHQYTETSYLLSERQHIHICPISIPSEEVVSTAVIHTISKDVEVRYHSGAGWIVASRRKLVSLRRRKKWKKEVEDIYEKRKTSKVYIHPNTIQSEEQVNKVILQSILKVYSIINRIQKPKQAKIVLNDDEEVITMLLGVG